MNSLAKQVISAVILLTLALASAGRASDLPTLIEALGDTNNRRGASIALTRLGSDAVPSLRKSLTSSNPDVRVWSAYTLGEIGPNAVPAIAELKTALNSDDKAVRSAAAGALGKIGEPQAVASLTAALGDKDVEVRQQAIIALGRIGKSSKSAVPELIAALSDHRFRAETRRSLIRIGPAATTPLVEQLGNDVIRFDVAAVLREINPTEVAKRNLTTPTAADLKSLRLVLHDQTRTPAERIIAAQSLAVLGTDGYKVLIAAFETESIARTAAEAFSADDSEAVPLLIESLSHKRSDVRSHAANALGAIGENATAAVPSLIKLLQDDNRNVRYSSVRALHELGPKAGPAVNALAQVILNPREVEATRQWAIKTLVVTLPETHDEVVKALIEASQEKTNYGVRQLAIQTLRIIDPKAAEEAGLK